MQVVRATPETSQVVRKSPPDLASKSATALTKASEITPKKPADNAKPTTTAPKPTATKTATAKPTTAATTTSATSQSKSSKSRQRGGQTYRIRCNSDGEDEHIEVKPVKRTSNTDLRTNPVKVSRTNPPQNNKKFVSHL